MDPSEDPSFDVGISDPRNFFYARILTLIQVTFLCGVTIGVLDPDWIHYSSFRSETPVLNPCVSHIFHLSLGSVNFLWILKALTFFFLDPHLYSRGSAFSQQPKYPYALLTLLPCVIARDQGGGGGRRRQ